MLTLAKVGGAAAVVLPAIMGITSSVGATTTPPTIRSLKVSPSTITVAKTRATVSAVVTHASSCTLSATPSIPGLPASFSCSKGTVRREVAPPANRTKKAGVKYTLTLTAKGTGGSKTATAKMLVALEDTLTGVKSIASGSASSTKASSDDPNRRVDPSVSAAKYGAYCAVVTGGTVECWGDGETGALGNGAFDYSASSVQVVGVGGTGFLSGVTSVAGNDLSFCALLDSGNVDCWGYGFWGDLGDAAFYTTDSQGSDEPVQVSGVDGSGLLSGVSSIASDGDDTYCAILNTGQVDCWGKGAALGNGVPYEQTCSGPCDMSQVASDTPVQVLDPDGVDLLAGVQSLTGGFYSFCAVLISGGVDCWGDDYAGQNGDRSFVLSGDPVSFTPTAVVGIGDDGLVSGVTNLVSDGNYAFCASTTGGGVECWGWGAEGELGNGVDYANGGSGTPVQVVSEDGTTTLSNVANVTGGLQGFCALLTSGDVDCWGTDEYGALGNGEYSNDGGFGTDTPVSVVDTTGTDDLSGATAISGGVLNYCATLGSSGLDCWGYGNYGALGNGTLYEGDPAGDGTPSQVIGGVNGSDLATVEEVSVATESGNDTFCALFGSAGQVACWGYGNDGELGDGNVYPQGNATPVDVISSQ
jgi:alpha-tubulin suppressor-like RCC1 family protein